jgi:hypothetical protein
MHPRRDSFATCIAVLFELIPVEGVAKSRGSGADSFHRRSYLRPVDPSIVWNQARDWFAMTRNQHFFTALNSIEERTQGVLGFECSDFQHFNFSWLSLAYFPIKPTAMSIADVDVRDEISS